MDNVGIKRINDIIKSTLDVIEQSKGAIFDISENARREVYNLKEELQYLKTEAATIMENCKKLENKVIKSRQRLAAINRNFDKYSEEEMQQAYKETNELMVELAVIREREKNTISRRNDVERRLKSAIETVGKAEKLVAQVGTVLNYLSGDLQKLDEHFENTENKRLIAIRIIKAQENERRRIAREIHDGPAQAMSNVVLKAEICEKMAEIDMQGALNELTKLKDVVRLCLKDVRRVIYDLRPMSIDDLGIKTTLQKYIESFSNEHSIKIDLNIKGNDSRIKDSNISLAIFRVVQECLNNTYKHANATYINVQIECTEKVILLRIKDDGQGFDINSINDISSRDDDGGFGIIGMKERIELLEGTFKISSEINSGTTVKVRLPYGIQGGIV
ncbi:MAG: sensor histidine kinase [Clostridiaceae bacterium]|nr:sensor histidine kinase [Clostridiaceae bacterium]